MKDSKYYKKKYMNNKSINSSWLTKLLLSVIIVLVSLIVTNFDQDIRNGFSKIVLEENMKFSDFNKIYKKLMNNKDEETELVSNVVVDESLMEEEAGRYKFNYGVDYPVEILAPGVIVYYGDKDTLNDTVIVQGNDGIDIWYSGVVMNEYSLYDYVSKGDILGASNDVYVTISIVKDGELLKYEEYFK